MAKYLQKGKNEIGLSPQELVFRGPQKIDKVKLRLIDFDEANVDEKVLKKIGESAPYSKKDSVSWINIDGLHDLDLLRKFGEEFHLNKLILSNVLETNARPKVQEFTHWIFISIKMLQFNEINNEISVENLSLIFNDSMLISFQEKKGDVFEPVRERIRHQKRTLRSSRTDYLAFALIDTVVDHYLYILGLFGEKIESFDELLLDEPGKEVVEGINLLKKELNYIRKSVKPAKEMILSLSKLESDFIDEKNDIYFKELVNNINQASDTSDVFRELLSDQLNIYHMMISSKLNDTMKFLTIFSVIFIPLTFIAGIYGTNFEIIPELKYQYGYYMMLACMAVVAIGMLIYFKRKKWL